MKTIAFALLTVALAAPAMAADSQQEGPKPKPHLICKRDQDTATRMSARVCKTKEQWVESGADDNGGKLDSINRQATTRDIGATLDAPHSRPPS
jgi:hypothetical protein